MSFYQHTIRECVRRIQALPEYDPIRRIGPAVFTCGCGRRWEQEYDKFAGNYYVLVTGDEDVDLPDDMLAALRDPDVVLPGEMKVMEKVAAWVLGGKPKWVGARHALARFISQKIFRHDGEICQRCGWAVAWGCPTYWTTDDSFWNKIQGGEGGIRCIRCFTRDCLDKGIVVRWTVQPDSETITSKRCNHPIGTSEALYVTCVLDAGHNGPHQPIQTVIKDKEHGR